MRSSLRSPPRLYGALLALLGPLSYAPSAHALQPLRVFVERARSDNNDNRSAVATREQRDAESDVALGRALPSIAVRGILTRSQLNPSLPGANGQPAAPLIPQDIYLVSAGLTVPINVGSWEQTAAANAAARAANAAARATSLSVERDVTQTYYNVVGSEALVETARHGLALSTSNYQTVQAQTREGESSVLDLERARADVARAEQDLADAENNLFVVRRQLRSKTGVEPEPGNKGDVPADDLHDEGPISSWENQGVEQRPTVLEAKETTAAAARSLDAARVAWLPTLSASAQEQYTNATENFGRKDFYSLLGLATWKLDLTTPATVSAQHAALNVARARESQARIDAQDAVYFAWLQVRTDVQKTRSARVQEDAASHAADLARERFLAGEATQIDVLQAQQTYVQAEAARVRVESDLAYARVALRLSVSDGANATAR